MQFVPLLSNLNETAAVIEEKKSDTVDDRSEDSDHDIKEPVDPSDETCTDWMWRKTVALERFLLKNMPLSGKELPFVYKRRTYLTSRVTCLFSMLMIYIIAKNCEFQFFYLARNSYKFGI